MLLLPKGILLRFPSFTNSHNYVNFIFSLSSSPSGFSFQAASGVRTPSDLRYWFQFHNKQIRRIESDLKVETPAAFAQVMLVLVLRPPTSVHKLSWFNMTTNRQKVFYRLLCQTTSPRRLSSSNKSYERRPQVRKCLGNGTSL